MIISRVWAARKWTRILLTTVYLIFLKQCLSLSLELTDLAWLWFGMISDQWGLKAPLSLLPGIWVTVTYYTTIPSFTHECWWFELRYLCLHSKSLTNWAISPASWQSFECVDMVFLTLWHFWCLHWHWFSFFISCNYYWCCLFLSFSFSVLFEVCKHYWFFKTVGFVFIDFLP